MARQPTSTHTERNARDKKKSRSDALRRDQARLTKIMVRLLTGYPENLITLEELRCRMPELRKLQRANEAELQSLEMIAVDPTRNLRLVETLTAFRRRLRARGNVLEVTERQRVIRLLVQEILVGRDNITIRHFHSHADFFARLERSSSTKP